MTAKIEFRLVGSVLNVSILVLIGLLTSTSVTAASEKATKQPNFIDRLMFVFKGGQQPNRPRLTAPGARRTKLAGSKSPENTNCEADIIALIPEQNLGVTATDTPTLWFYIPSDRAVTSLKFTLLDPTSPERQELWTKELATEFKQKPGLFKVRYQGKPLTDSLYQWEFSYQQAGCNNSQILSGAIRKEIHPDLGLAKDRSARLRSYGQNGIWHELLTELITARQQQPQDPQLTADLKYLLPYAIEGRSVEFDRDLTEKIVNAQVIN